MAHAIVEVIERHDRNRVEPIGVSLSAPDGSAIGARVRSAFETLIDAASMSDRDIVSRLRDLEIDIAVDLAGFTVGARTSIFAARCAPVQVNYLGFPASTGAPFMDCIIADPVVIPAGQEAAYTERVVRLPHCYLPWDSKRGGSLPPVERTDVGLPSSGMVFCGFNNSYKITREVFQIWMSLLRDVPDSVLWLRSMNSDAAENLRRAAATLQICDDRIIFAAHVEKTDQYLARLGLADLFLDTYPYNAHTTAADALCAGVPVLTCRGDSFASRVGASLLTSAGLPELICTTPDDYRAKALALATSLAELRSIRARLIEARSSAPVFDTVRYTRNLEALYFNIWDDAVAGRAAGPGS